MPTVFLFYGGRIGNDVPGNPIYIGGSNRICVVRPDVTNSEFVAFVKQNCRIGDGLDVSIKCRVVLGGGAAMLVDVCSCETLSALLSLESQNDRIGVFYVETIAGPEVDQDNGCIPANDATTRGSHVSQKASNGHELHRGSPQKTPQSRCAANTVGLAGDVPFNQKVLLDNGSLLEIHGFDPVSGTEEIDPLQLVVNVNGPILNNNAINTPSARASCRLDMNIGRNVLPVTDGALHDPNTTSGSPRNETDSDCRSSKRRRRLFGYLFLECDGCLHRDCRHCTLKKETGISF